MRDLELARNRISRMKKKVQDERNSLTFPMKFCGVPTTEFSREEIDVLLAWFMLQQHIALKDGESNQREVEVECPWCAETPYSSEPCSRCRNTGHVIALLWKGEVA